MPNKNRIIFLVGLGNPGVKYLNTRHNVGHMVVDALKKWKVESGKWKITKTNVFMNDSGTAVKKLNSKFKIQNSDLYIIHDDLDIPIGKFKIQKGRGPKNHNGVLSVEEELGTTDFWRIRVGIENREKDAGKREQGEIYTLQDFLPEEKEIIDKVIEEIKGKLTQLT